MKSKNVIFVLALVIVVFAIVIGRLRQEPKEKEIFDRNAELSEYAPYAKCKMHCNDVSADDIQYIKTHGIINMNETDRYRQPCPIFALQGTLSSGKKLRVFFSQCSDSTIVLDCLDLEQRRNCDCQNFK